MLTTHKTGLALGGFLAIWHLSWSVLVLAGVAQALIDWVFWLHFIQPPYRVGDFSATRAGTLIALTAALGYVSGYILGWILNKLERS